MTLACPARGCDGAVRPSRLVAGWWFCPLCKALTRQPVEVGPPTGHDR